MLAVQLLVLSTVRIELYFHSPHISDRKEKQKEKANLSLSFVPLRETNIHEDIFGMIQQNETHDNRRNEIEKKKTKNLLLLLFGNKNQIDNE